MNDLDSLLILPDNISFFISLFSFWKEINQYGSFIKSYLAWCCTLEKFCWVIPDITFKHHDLAICIGEIKSLNASKDQVEEDRIRIAEILKKLLHIRMSKTNILMNSLSLELWCLINKLNIVLYCIRGWFFCRWNYRILYHEIWREAI